MSAFRTELRQLLRLAGPLAAAQAGTQIMSLVDLAVLGRLGARELGAAGLGNAIFFTISILGIGLNLGVDPMISQAFGAGDAVRARHVMWQGVWLALGVTVVLTILLLFAPLLLPLFDVAEPLRPIAGQFESACRSEFSWRQSWECSSWSVCWPVTSARSISPRTSSFSDSPR